ncbi:Myb/SANT-like domain [Dillenia turbinata]|uniref:Myb/SANT-like domain n=1 Tax=Dillenia turbinata TaxID=194707 RepID=A0AAN8UKW8_9MAGN
MQILISFSQLFPSSSSSSSLYWILPTQLLIFGDHLNPDLEAEEFRVCLDITYSGDFFNGGFELDAFLEPDIDSSSTWGGGDQKTEKGNIVVEAARPGMKSRGEPVKNGQLTNCVTWTADMDRVLCSLMIDQMNHGNKLSGKLSWRASTWPAAIKTLHQELNIVVTKASVQNRLRTLSRHYSIVADILKHPSFSWDHDKNRLKVANESAWNEYCESHPDARPYRKIVIEYWEDICTIFAQDEAIEDNAQTPREVDLDMIHKDSNDAEESKETAGSNDTSLDDNCVSEGTKSPSRVKEGRRSQTSKYVAWATDMDRVLSQVLIEQMNINNKLDGKFSWKAPAWAAAVRALEEEVDVVVTKTNVQSRLKTWYKYYTVIGDILKQPGISWDYQRHRLKVSSESSWNDYCKSHPDAKPYRKITIENWQDICTLFAPDGNTGEGAQLGVGFKNQLSQREFNHVEEPNVVSDLEDTGLNHDVSTLEGGNQQEKSNPFLISTLPSRKRKRHSLDSINATLGHLAEILEKYLKFFAPRPLATTQMVLHEVSKVPGLSQAQLLRAVDLLMNNQRKFDTFSGLPNDLKVQWLLLHLGG